MKKVETLYNASIPIEGICHEDFQEVAELFAQNFDIYREIGASVCVVVDGDIKIRPIMYLALSYDHRIIDGKESVSFLKTIKENLEDPRRLFLDI